MLLCLGACDAHHEQGFQFLQYIVQGLRAACGAAEGDRAFNRGHAQYRQALGLGGVHTLLAQGISQDGFPTTKGGVCQSPQFFGLAR